MSRLTIGPFSHHGWCLEAHSWLQSYASSGQMELAMWIAPQAPPEEASQKNGLVGKKRLEFVGKVEGISHGGWEWEGEVDMSCSLIRPGETACVLEWYPPFRVVASPYKRTNQAVSLNKRTMELGCPNKPKDKIRSNWKMVNSLKEIRYAIRKGFPL